MMVCVDSLYPNIATESPRCAASSIALFVPYWISGFIPILVQMTYPTGSRHAMRSTEIRWSC